MLFILFRVFTLTWRNAFLSITRYVVNTATHKGSPHSNRTVIKWFLVAIAFTIVIYTILPMYHVTTLSIQIQTFCAHFNCQGDEGVTYQNNSICSIESPTPPDMFSLEWSLTLAKFVGMLLGAALGYAADWKLKVFVEKQKKECEQLGIPVIDLDDTIPVNATRISMSSIVISILAFPVRFFIGTWAFSCFLNVMVSLQVPMLAFLTFKHQQENLESHTPGKFGAIENSRFMKEFPLNEVETRRPSRPTKIVKRVQWKVGHWGQNGSYHEPSSLGCKEFCRWDSQQHEKAHLHFNTMVTPDTSKDKELPVNVYHIVSQDESQDLSQDLSQEKTPEISLDVSQNVSQDLSNLSQEVQQYVTDCLLHDIYTQDLPQDVSYKQGLPKLSHGVVSQYLSTSGDISHCFSNEHYHHQALPQDETKNLSLCRVLVHMPKEESQFEDKSKGLSQTDSQDPSIHTSDDDNLATC